MRDFGGAKSFRGRIITVRVFEDNVLVREASEDDGRGRVPVVVGGASTRCALMGDWLAGIGHENGWDGIVVNGRVRDPEELASIPAGVKALAAVLRRSGKEGAGERDVAVAFAGADAIPADHFYVVADRFVVADRDLLCR